MEKPDCFPVDERFKKQIQFILEIDKVKQVFRQTYLLDKKRKENDAEHSWHFALVVILLAEYANEKIDILKTVKMALIHDLVEIDAGDTIVYDVEARKAKEAVEEKAAERIFGLLPDDQGREMLDLWKEFEVRETPEARFAAAIDRLQPMLNNYFTDGIAWQEHGITADQTLARNEHMGKGSEKLWEYAQKFVDDAVKKEFLDPPLDT